MIKGNIFLVNYPSNVGTYVNDSFTATALDSDAYIENNRTIDKAIREVNRVLLVPKVSEPAYIDPDSEGLEPFRTVNRCVNSF